MLKALSQQIARLFKQGWRLYKEMNAVHGLLVAFGIVAPSTVIAGAVHFLGEHSLAVSVVVFVLVVVLSGLLLFAYLGYRAERSGQAGPLRIAYIEFLAIAAEELRVEKNSVDAYHLMQAIRQGGADGSIQFYGNHRPHGRTGGMTLQQAAAMTTLDEIPRELFKTYWIETQPKSNLEAVLSDPASTNRSIYSNLHVNRSQATAWLKRDARYEFEVKRGEREQP